MMVDKYLKIYPEAASGRKVVFLHGGLSSKQRRQMLEEVLSSPDPYILLTPFQVGGVGLNLQKFTMIIFLDRSWNPQVSNHTFSYTFYNIITTLHATIQCC